MEKNYPNHDRVPNVIVRGLYSVGYFIGDFVPLLLNLIDGVYWAIKRLVAFIVGLLVESSIFVVIIGSIVFSVTHSIEQMRSVGATNGLEYVGILMFEVIYIGSSATLTSFLIKKRKPVGFIEWMGLIFTLLGFFVGLGFVWWSNVNGMAPTKEGFIIGSMVPVLVLISEGILAFLQHNTTKGDNYDNSNHQRNRNANTMIANNDNGNNYNSNQRQQGKTDKYNKSTNDTDKSDSDSATVRNTLKQQQHSNNDDDDNDNSNTNVRRSMSADNGDNNNKHGCNTTNANSALNSSDNANINRANNTNINHSDNTTVDTNHNNTDNNDTTKKVVNMNERRKKRRELDPDTVIAIFQAEGSNAHIGRKFGVSAETVRKIKLGERHADLTAPYRQAK